MHKIVSLVFVVVTGKIRVGDLLHVRGCVAAEALLNHLHHAFDYSSNVLPMSYRSKDGNARTPWVSDTLLSSLQAPWMSQQGRWSTGLSTLPPTNG